MTVEWLIHLLQQQDPKAEVFLWSERFDLHSDILSGHDPVTSRIEKITTFPGEKGVYLIERDDRNYF